MRSVICLAESAKMTKMFAFTLGVSRQRYIYFIFCVYEFLYTLLCILDLFLKHLKIYFVCICLKLLWIKGDLN